MSWTHVTSLIYTSLITFRNPGKLHVITMCNSTVMNISCSSCSNFWVLWGFKSLQLQPTLRSTNRQLTLSWVLNPTLRLIKVTEYSSLGCSSIFSEGGTGPRARGNLRGTGTPQWCRSGRAPQRRHISCWTGGRRLTHRRGHCEGAQDWWMEDNTLHFR
jgi:hypothetical protein